MASVRALAVLAGLAAVSAAQATVYFDSDFSTFAPGNLVGQGGWIQQGGLATSPLQVSGGKVLIPGTQTGDNQDARQNFVHSAANGSLFFGATLKVNAAPNASGGASYILAALESSSSAFANFRVSVRSSGAGTYQLGIRATGQSANPFVWGGNLNIGQEYNLLLAWDFIAGTQNDLISAYVNPTSLVRGANTAYATQTQGNATADPAGFQAFVISQFQSSTVPIADSTIGRVAAGNDFGQIAALVPTPGALALLGLGGLVAARRKR